MRGMTLSWADLFAPAGSPRRGHWPVGVRPTPVCVRLKSYARAPTNAPGPAADAPFAAAMDAIARQPEAAGTLSRTLFVGLAMIETMAIYTLVIELLVLFANPFV